jgi:hypothetical protein
MPLHDYYCGTCGQTLLNVYVPVSVGGPAGAPLHCDRPMAWIPAAPATHYGDVKGCAFHAFDTTDGRGNPVRIDSLRKLRQVERESEQMARDGVGQPMVFRRWAQDPSNADQPTLSPTYNGGEQPSKDAAHRFGSTLRKSAEEPDHAFGPAVNESNASALAMSGKE